MKLFKKKDQYQKFGLKVGHRVLFSVIVEYHTRPQSKYLIQKRDNFCIDSIVILHEKSIGLKDEIVLKHIIKNKLYYLDLTSQSRKVAFIQEAIIPHTKLNELDIQEIIAIIPKLGNRVDPIEKD